MWNQAAFTRIWTNATVSIAKEVNDYAKRKKSTYTRVTLCKNNASSVCLVYYYEFLVR